MNRQVWLGLFFPSPSTFSFEANGLDICHFCANKIKCIYFFNQAREITCIYFANQAIEMSKKVSDTNMISLFRYLWLVDGVSNWRLQVFNCYFLIPTLNENNTIYSSLKHQSGR